MSGRHFYLSETKDRVARAITDLEKTTGAEVMVVVRPGSGHYRHTDYLVGVAFLMAGLLVFLFHPAPFRDDLFPLEAALLFLLGVFVSANVPDVRRLLTARSLRDRAVKTAAHAAMIELGVTRTDAHVGVLVYVSLFERHVEVVADVGLQEASRDPAFQRAADALEHSVHPPDVDAFLAALTALGAVLAAHCPRRTGDVDELPNEMHAS